MLQPAYFHTASQITSAPDLENLTGPLEDKRILYSLHPNVRKPAGHHTVEYATRTPLHTGEIVGLILRVLSEHMLSNRY